MVPNIESEYMLRNLKVIIPWVLVVILLGILLWPKKTKKIESTIESRLQIEESLIDSFSSSRESIILERDLSLSQIDTLEVLSLVSILKENMMWYENKNVSPQCYPGDSVSLSPNRPRRGYYSVSGSVRVEGNN